MTPLGDMDIMETQTATFICEVSKPKQKAEWFKNGNKIKSSNRIEVRMEETKHFLVIKDAVTKDEAEYTITFKNKSSTGSLFVEGIIKDICIDTIHCVHSFIT